MRPAILCRRITRLGLFALATAASAADATLAQRLETAAIEYQRRLDEASQELAATREHAATAIKPLLDEVHALEEQVAALEARLTRTRTEAAELGETKARRQADADAAAKSLAYLAALAQDNLKVTLDALLPGEAIVHGAPLEALAARLQPADTPEAEFDATAAVEVFAAQLERTRRALGGHVAEGQVLLATDNRVLPASFAFAGSESYFVAPDAGLAGVLRLREGAPLPIAHPLQTWTVDEARRFLAGEDATLPVDAASGRALRLQQVRGTLIDHLRHGGVIGIVILGLGLVALGVAAIKAFTLRQLAVDERAAVRRALDRLAANQGEHGAALPSLAATTRELVATGCRNWNRSREVLEERLFAFVLQERLRHERLLPMLAVIVAAAPLLGLLGTVTGMVKTFTLITIYGTGNAAKLSSGISEALVTTELGLIVAIPTLLAHGFLAHRTKRKLALLEAHAQEIVTTVGESREKPDPDRAAEMAAS